MSAETLQTWLDKKKSRGFTLNLLLGIAALVAGLVVMFLTFWFTYAVVWIGWGGVSAVTELTLNKELHLAHEWRLVISATFIVLLCIQHLKTNPWHWGDYARRDYYPALATRYHFGAMAALLSHPGTSANMIADILLSGSRLVFGSVNVWQKALALRRMDAAGCAQLLAFLATQMKPVPHEELSEAGWDAWLEQLKLLDGVVFLQKGVKLSEELRKELAAAHSG